MQRSSILFILLTACGGGGGDLPDTGPADGGADTSMPPDSSADAARVDAAADAAADASLDAMADGGTDAGPVVPEDCATDLDEDDNGYAGCLDPVCWSEPHCVEGALEREGLDGWLQCGDSISLDEAATAERCGGGTSFPTERSFLCGEVPTALRLEVYCEPDDGPGRALRYLVTMDLSPEDEPLGPMAFRHTSYTAELGVIGALETTAGGGASGGADSVPSTDAWLLDQYEATAWVKGLSLGANVVCLLGASSQVSNFVVLDDGSVAATHEDPLFFITAGFEIDI